MSNKGVVSFISNFSYLGDPSFVVMRQRFLAGVFDKLWVDCMNGDSREIRQAHARGQPHPSVFSTRSITVRHPGRHGGLHHGPQAPRRKNRRYVFGISGRARPKTGEDLLASLKAKRFDAAYKVAKPNPENRFSFRPENVSSQ